MGFLRAQVTIPYDSAIPRDASVNTFHFITDAVGTKAQESLDIYNRLVTFYNAIDVYLSQTVGPNATVKTYDLEAAEPRVPIYTNTIGLVPGAGATPMPNEVALVVTWAADFSSGTPRARRRGRTYLGPMDSGNTVLSGSDVRWGSTICTNVAAAAGTLDNSAVGGVSGSTITMCVFSRADAGAPSGAGGAYGSAQLVGAFHPITNGWVDNAVDIQRKRGLPATTRTTFL